MSVEKKKKHKWLYDAFAAFYTCETCKEEVSGFLFDYYRNGEEDSTVVLDRIANKECKDV
jgi:hypothetical protein